MTTAEAVKRAAEEWDDVIDDGGSVCVVIGPDAEISPVHKKLKRFLKDIGYGGSFGVKKRQTKEG